MISFDPDDFPGSRPARRADGQPWRIEDLRERVAPLANAPACPAVLPQEPVISGRHSLGLTGQSRQSGHLKGEQISCAVESDQDDKAAGPMCEEKGTVSIRTLGREQNPAPPCASVLDADEVTLISNESVPLTTTDTIPAKLLDLLRRQPDGVTARDVLRARLAHDSAGAIALLDTLTASGLLVRRETIPHRGGKPLIVYALRASKTQEDAARA